MQFHRRKAPSQMSHVPSLSGDSIPHSPLLHAQVCSHPPSTSLYNPVTNLQVLQIYNTEVAVANCFPQNIEEMLASLEVAYGDADAQIPLHAQGNYPCRS
jgi:hypothetical protein